MDCREIKEKLVDLLYVDPDDPSVRGLKMHLDACRDCQKEYADLQRVREILGTWKDEPPLRPFVLPTGEYRRTVRRSVPWYLRRIAAAAIVFIAVLGMANADISWTDSGFSFRTRLFRFAGAGEDHYTKEEVRNLLKAVLNDSEARMTETNFLMMQRMMDTIAAERNMELRLINLRSEDNRRRN